MTELFYFVAGLALGLASLGITLRLAPTKRLCGYLETTTTFDERWVLTHEKVRFLIDDRPTSCVLHHTFYLWNGGNAAIRSDDIPDLGIASIVFEGESHLSLDKIEQAGQSFQSDVEFSENVARVRVTHLDSGQGLWIYFTENVNAGGEKCKIAFEGYAVEAGNLIKNVKPLTAKRSFRILILPFCMLIFMIPFMVFNIYIVPEIFGWIFGVFGVILVAVIVYPFRRAIKGAIHGFRYRVPKEFERPWGAFYFQPTQEGRLVYQRGSS